MSGFPLFWRGQLLFCGGINKLRTNCCDEEEEEEEDHDEDDDDYDRDDYDYCYEDEIPDPCDPYPVPTEWGIGAVCEYVKCGPGYEMSPIDISLEAPVGCYTGFTHFHNWPLGDVVYELGSSRVARQVFFKLYVDSALVSSTAVDVPPDEAYEYRSIAPEALTDTGAHHVRLLIQWEQDGYCDGQMRIRVAEIYTYCQYANPVDLYSTIVFPRGVYQKDYAIGHVQIYSSGNFFDGVISKILGYYDTANDADAVLDLFPDKIAHFAYNCVCPPVGVCDISHDLGYQFAAYDSSVFMWKLEGYGGKGDPWGGWGCDQNWIEYSVTAGSKIYLRKVDANGDVSEAPLEGVLLPCERIQAYAVTEPDPDDPDFDTKWSFGGTHGYLYPIADDCRFNDTEDAWYGKWDYDTGDCDAGVPANQDQLDHYNANCGGMASLLLGEMPERLV